MCDVVWIGVFFLWFACVDACVCVLCLVLLCGVLWLACFVCLLNWCMCVLNMRVLFVMHCVILCGLLFVVVVFFCVSFNVCVGIELLCDVVVWCVVMVCLIKCVGAWFDNACMLSAIYRVMFYGSVVCVMCYVGVCPV